MSAHFDGGAEIAGRRLREVEVTYIDDPTLDMGAEDSDDCPASPPPTYYLRVREEKRRKGPRSSSSGGGTAQSEGGTEETSGGGNGEGEKKVSAWSWRYVNVEKKALLVWDRRGGQLMRTIPLKLVDSLLVIPDEEAPASILEISIAPSPPDSGGSGDAPSRGTSAASEGDGGVLVLQARSRRETLLWAKVLQENVELMTKRQVPLKNLDEETSLSDVQQLAKLLTHQLSELQQADNKPPSPQQKQQQQQQQQQQQPPLPPPQQQQQQGH